MNGEQFEKIRRRKVEADDTLISNSGKAKREWNGIPLHKKHAAVKTNRHKRLRTAKVPKKLRRMLEDDAA